MLNIANILCPVFVHSHRFLKSWKQLAVGANFQLLEDVQNNCVLRSPLLKIQFF